MPVCLAWLVSLFGSIHLIKQNSGEFLRYVFYTHIRGSLVLETTGVRKNKTHIFILVKKWLVMFLSTTILIQLKSKGHSMTEEELKKENEELKEENKLFKQALEAISKINGGAAIVARDALGIKKIEVRGERWKCGPPGQPPVKVIENKEIL